MADENVIIEENEQNVGEYDPNPYDNVTVEEALKQLFNRFTPRTVRQAIFTMAENNKPATLIDKSITENGTYAASADNADGYSKVTVDVAGGGGETFEVEITVVVTPLEQGTSGTFTTSKTIQETIDAIKAGKQIVFSATWNEREANIVCYAAYNNSSFGEAICMWIYDEQTICPIIWMTDNDTFMVENTPAIFVF